MGKEDCGYSPSFISAHVLCLASCPSLAVSIISEPSLPLPMVRAFSSLRSNRFGHTCSLVPLLFVFPKGLDSFYVERMLIIAAHIYWAFIMCARHCAKCFTRAITFTSWTSPVRGVIDFSSHFTAEESKAQRVYVALGCRARIWTWQSCSRAQLLVTKLRCFLFWGSSSWEPVVQSRGMGPLLFFQDSVTTNPAFALVFISF